MGTRIVVWYPDTYRTGSELQRAQERCFRRVVGSASAQRHHAKAVMRSNAPCIACVLVHLIRPLLMSLGEPSSSPSERRTWELR